MVVKIAQGPTPRKNNTVLLLLVLWTVRSPSGKIGVNAASLVLKARRFVSAQFRNLHSMEVRFAQCYLRPRPAIQHPALFTVRSHKRGSQQGSVARPVVVERSTRFATF
jgi:hypothetical protein